MELLDVTSIQHGCVYDGDGVRTTVFLRGCPFHCPWCCNPETLQSRDALFVDDEKCFLLKGIVSPLCNDCERKDGKRPICLCPFGVAEHICERYSAERLYKDLVADKSLYEQSCGGVTFSGGDPLLHSARLLPLLQRLKEENIHIAYETTLYNKDDELLRETVCYVEQWIIDLKLQPANFKSDYEDTLSRNLNILRDKNKQVSFRLVFVEQIKAHTAISALKRLNIDNLEIIKCHALAKTKYKKLMLPFEDYTPSENAFQEFVLSLKKEGLQVSTLTL